jgi:hypothetical protein
MSDSVVEIGWAAFARCTNLTSIVLSPSLTVIETNLFNYCKSLVRITIPEGVTNVKRLAFYQCESLTEIDLPNTVSLIGANAFQFCGALKKIELPQGLRRIGGRAFAFCSSLRDVSVSSDYLEIGCEIFYGAPDIQIKYLGTSDAFLNMVFAKGRMARPWETIGNAVLHIPESRDAHHFVYESTKDFCVEVICKKDGKHLIFRNNKDKTKRRK